MPEKLSERKPPLFGRFKEDCAWCDRMKREEERHSDLCAMCAVLRCDFCDECLVNHIEEDRWYWRCLFDSGYFRHNGTLRCIMSQLNTNMRNR